MWPPIDKFTNIDGSIEKIKYPFAFRYGTMTFKGKSSFINKFSINAKFTADATVLTEWAFVKIAMALALWICDYLL